MIKYSFEKWEKFLKDLFFEIEKSGIILANCQLDHIAYRTENSNEYESMKRKFVEWGDLNEENILSNRKIAVYKLYQPKKFRGFEFQALELMEPTSNNPFKSGWQHAEFKVHGSLQSFANRNAAIPWKHQQIDKIENSEMVLQINPELSVKFRPIGIIELQKIQHRSQSSPSEN